MAEVHTLASSIERVTVFREGAVVRRRAALPLQEGWPAELAIGPLPLALHDASVRVAIVAPLTERASVIAPQTIAPSPSDVRVHVVPPALGEPLIAPAEAEIRDARRELEHLRERHARIERELTQLGTLRLSLAEPRLKRRPRPAPLAAWRELDAWARAERRQRVLERTALEAEIVLAEEKVQALVQREGVARSRKDAGADPLMKEVRLRLRGGGDPPEAACIELEYVVPGATWAPTDVLRVARDGRSAALTVRALVAQRTGEPWERVALALSTAELLREADLPELTSLRIARRQESPATTGWRPPPEGGHALFQALDQALAALPARESLARRPAELELIERAARQLDTSEPRPRAQGPAAPAAPPAGRPKTDRPAPAPPSPRPVLASAAMPIPASAATPIGAPMPQVPQASDFALSRRSVSPTPDLPRKRALRPREPLEARAAEEALAQELAGDELALASPLPPSPARPGQDTLRYGNLVMRGWNEPGRGHLSPAPGAGSAEVAQARRLAAGISATPLPAGAWVVAPVGGFDHRYDAEAPVDVPSDGGFHGVTLLSREAPLRSTLVVVPRESEQAVRVATFTNPLRGPLLPGPADVYWGDELLVTSPVRVVPPGGTLRIGLGVDERLKVARNAHHEEETQGLLSASTHLRHEVVIDIASRLAEPVEVEVRERLPVKDDAEKEDLDVALGRVDPPWEDYDQSELGPPIRGGRRWRFTLEPGREQRLAYSFVVKIGAKHELVGGNRRV